MHFGAVVSAAPSPLSTPRSAAGQAQLRLGKPLRMKCRASPVLLFMRAGRIVAGTVGIVRATVPFHGEHDAPEPTKDGLRFSTVRLPTPRCVCVSVNLFSLSLSLRLLRLCVLLLRDPLVQAGVGCRRRARSRSRRWLSKTSARWSALWPGAASAGGRRACWLGARRKGGRWGPASARGGPGVSSIPESSRCVRVADRAGGAQARSLPNSNNTLLLTAD